MKVQIFAAGAEGDHVADVIQHRRQLVRRRDDLHLPRLDLGKIKNIVDDGEQVFAGTLHITRVGGDPLVVAFPQDHLIHAEYRIDRRADLMGHVGKEAALCSAGRIRGLLFQPEYHLIIGLLLLAHPEAQCQHHGEHEDGQDSGNDKQHDPDHLCRVIRGDITRSIQKRSHPAGQRIAAHADADDHHDKDHPQDSPEGGHRPLLQVPQSVPVHPCDCQREHHVDDVIAQVEEGIKIHHPRCPSELKGRGRAELEKGIQQQHKINRRFFVPFRPSLPLIQKPLYRKGGDQGTTDALQRDVQNVSVPYKNMKRHHTGRNRQQHQRMEIPSAFPFPGTSRKSIT